MNIASIIPGLNADISLDSGNSLLVDESMGESDQSHDVVPWSFCTVILVSVFDSNLVTRRFNLH